MSSFCTAKATHIFSAKNFSIFAYHSIKILTVSLTNDIVSFEQLGPVLSGKAHIFNGRSKKSQPKQSSSSWWKSYADQIWKISEHIIWNTVERPVKCTKMPSPPTQFRYYLYFTFLSHSLYCYRMCEGEKRKLVIPADMGYGSRGAPPKIPGMSFLQLRGFTQTQ